MDNHTNITDITEKADRALAALRAYQREVNDNESDDAITVTDLLADLIHMCERDGYAFDQRLIMARIHADEEADEEKQRHDG